MRGMLGIFMHTFKNFDQIQLAVKFMCGDKNLRITFLNPTQLIIKTENASGFRIYHPTNKQTMAMLVEYLKANGILE